VRKKILVGNSKLNNTKL